MQAAISVLDQSLMHLRQEANSITNRINIAKAQIVKESERLQAIEKEMASMEEAQKILEGVKNGESACQD